MQPLQPDQANFLLHGVLLPAIKGEHRITRSIIEAIPVDKGDYRPDEVSKSALELAWHIVAAEMRFMEAVAAGGFDLTPNPRPESVKTSADLSEWYAGNFDSRLQALTTLSNEQLTKIVGFRAAFQLPAVMYLNFMLHHTIHHRGQLTMCLRPIGGKVPAIYGDSHDSALARKATT